MMHPLTNRSLNINVLDKSEDKNESNRGTDLKYGYESGEYGN